MGGHVDVFVSIVVHIIFCYWNNATIKINLTFLVISWGVNVYINTTIFCIWCDQRLETEVLCEIRSHASVRHKKMASFAGNNKCSIIASNYASALFFVLFFSLAMLDMHVAHEVRAAPTLFLFGDSTFDVGTNNFLNSKAKANLPYYGIDFYQSIPTGRFSNGLNTADQIGKHINLNNEFSYKIQYGIVCV